MSQFCLLPILFNVYCQKNTKKLNGKIEDRQLIPDHQLDFSKLIWNSRTSLSYGHKK